MKKGNLKLSIVVLAGNNYDKKLYMQCKKTFNFADEIVEVDSKDIESFAFWRNRGMKQAKGEWVLYLDTDEEVTSSLKEEVEKIINTESSLNAYAVPRRNFIFGKEFKHSGQYPDYQIRLFRKKYFDKWTGDVHEQPNFKGELGYLKSAMIHHKNMTISEMVDKTNKWSEIEADLMYKANHPPMNALRFFSAGFREFVQRFLKEKAFLDGKEGIIYGIYQIYSRLISYSKLWEKQLKDEK